MNNNIFNHIETNKETIEEIRKRLPEFLTEKRLLHTLSVEKEALCIAKKLFAYLEIDTKYLSDISAAALLHDITKKASIEEQQEFCRRFNIETDSISFSSCNLLHSKTAAYIAREIFHINDYVFSAIYNHTTGKENMNIYDKIIFLADYIEPTRTHKACIDARQSFRDSLNNEANLLQVLDKAVLSALDNTLIYLSRTGSPTDIQTIKARNYLLTHIQSDSPERKC